MKKIILIVSILFATLNVNAFNNEFNLGIFVPECIYCGHIISIDGSKSMAYKENINQQTIL